MRYVKTLFGLVALLGVPAAAVASEPASATQKAALARAGGERSTPLHCLTAVISTADRSWGELYFTGLWGGKQRMPSGCARYAANGVTIFHLRAGHWHTVTSGSDFVSSSGHCRVPGVPKRVVKDFRLCGSLF